MFLNTRKPEMEYFEKKKMFCSKVKILFLKKKFLECSETKQYGKIFCDIFARVSIKNSKLNFF